MVSFLQHYCIVERRKGPALLDEPMIEVDVLAAFTDDDIADEATVFIEDIVGLVDARDDAARQCANAECLEKRRQADRRAFPEMLAQIYASARRSEMQLRRIDAL